MKIAQYKSIENLGVAYALAYGDTQAYGDTNVFRTCFSGGLIVPR